MAPTAADVCDKKKHRLLVVLNTLFGQEQRALDNGKPANVGCLETREPHCVIFRHPQPCACRQCCSRLCFCLQTPQSCETQLVKNPDATHTAMRAVRNVRGGRGGLQLAPKTKQPVF